MIHSFILNNGLNNLTLVGNSFGGAVVLSTYLIANKDMKNRISNLILLDPAAYAQEEFPDKTIEIINDFIVSKLSFL